MALNTATFKTRTLSAILFAGIMLAGILWNKWSFFLLFSVIHAGCWIEYQKLIEIIHPAYRRISALHRYAFIAAGWIMMWIFVVEQVSPSPNLQLYLITLIAVLLLFALVADVWQSTFRWPVYFYSVAGLIYISLSWSLMIDLRFKGILRFGEQQVDLGWVVPLVLITAIWINDTMAYIVGSLIGKTPFSSISPNKTWEGTAGGALLAVVVVTGCWYAFVTPASWKEIACITLIAAIFGTAGDLLESKLKRLANVKDSGKILPGHGGFLDRFDSLLLATPVTWLYIQILDWLF